LLCELVANVEDLNATARCESMDLKQSELDELFDRANDTWESAKEYATKGNWFPGLDRWSLPMVIVEGQLALVKSDGMDNWFTIQKAEHSNLSYCHEVDDEEGGSYGSWIVSGRISDACVEGTAGDMLGIARAIQKRTEYSAKRCEVSCYKSRVLFHSPRNSRVKANVHMDVALRLAVQILQELDK